MQLRSLTAAVLSSSLVLVPVERVMAEAGDFAAVALIGAVVTQIIAPQQPQPMAVPANRRWALVIGVDSYQILERQQKKPQ